MKRILANTFLTSIVILSVLLSACQPGPAAESALPDPTDPPSTSTPEPPEVSEEESFLDENGFIVVSTEDERFPIVALGMEGQALAPLLVEGDDLSPANVGGAVWVGETGSEEDIVVSLGEDRLPAAMQVGEYVVLFSDYTETTVSLALFQGAELISMSVDVSYDGELMARYQELLAGGGQASSPGGHMLSMVPPGAESKAGKMFEMVGLMINLTACTASLAFPPSAWLVIGACGATFLSAVTTFTGEDLDIFGVEVPLIVIDAVGCIGAGDGLSCVSMIIDGIAIIADAFMETQEENEEVYEEAVEDLGCPSWFVYAETEWDGCASCATDRDLEKAWALALEYCEKECGKECWIMREPYCEVEP